MAEEQASHCPFTTIVLRTHNEAPSSPPDLLPASYHYREPSGRDIVATVDPANSRAFIKSELSIGGLGEMLKYLWLAGAKHPAQQLHFQIAIGREIVVADRMDLHLVWDSDRRIYIKPIPRFLLHSEFWDQNMVCSNEFPCQDSQTTECMGGPRKVALGFLYTYACLICSESDFFVANEKRLLPRMDNDEPIEWKNWKQLARELLQKHKPDEVHPRFLRAELRLSRINTINRLIHISPFTPYFGGWNNYSSFFRDNLAWIATATVFVALLLTAMQLGIATERLQGNASFQQASYGFTVFAILGPMCAIGLVALAALFNLFRDLPVIFKSEKAKLADAPQATLHGQNSPV